MALTPEAQTILNTLEASLLALSVDELKAFNEEFKELLKRLQDPAYAEAKTLEEAKAEIEKEFAEIIAILPPEQVERFKELQMKRITLDRHHLKAQLRLVTPKEKPKTKYLIDGKVIEWTGKGGGPKEIQDVLKKDGWNKDEKDAKKKAEQKMAILEKYLVKDDG